MQHLNEDLGKLIGMKGHVEKFMNSVNNNQNLIFSELTQNQLKEYANAKKK